MSTITIKVTIPEELRERFEARVQEHGGDQIDYLRELLERDLNGEERPHAGMTFAEIFAPCAEDFAATGMTDEELAEWVEAEVKASRAERRARRAAGE